MKKELIEFYLEWVNDYLTIEKMAEDKSLDQNDTRALIALGKKYHEQNVKALKELSGGRV